MMKCINSVYILLLLEIACIFYAPETRAQVNVLTQHNNLKRTGWNNNETILTQDNIANGNFGKIFTRKVDDQVYAQPLVISNLNIAGGLRNVVFVATVNNSVYAFDADDPAAAKPLWQANLTYSGYRPPLNTDMDEGCGGNYRNFIGNIGIVSTPVIDPATNSIYLVARSASKDGKTFVQYLHSLDIITGKEKANSPVYITASVPSYSEGNVNGVVTFDQKKHNQRAGLLLYDNTVFICWASHCDWGPYHGWVMGYDAKSMQQKYVYNVTRVAGLAGGIWMSGQAPAVDDEGYIYLTTGNGTVGTNGGTNPNDTTNRSESLLKLTTTSGNIQIADFFTPNNWEYLEKYDLDYGSDGVLLLPDSHLSLSGSKESYLFVVDNNNMGHTTIDNSNVIQILNVNALSNTYTNHLHGTPVYFKNETGQEYVYAWAEDAPLKQFPFNRSTMRFDADKVTEGNNRLSEGMPGAMLSVSSNGLKKGTGLLWASHPSSGDAIEEIVPGILQVFDPNDITHELWNSNMNRQRDSIGRFAKFVCPTVANGKVYMATFSNELVVYGLNAPKTTSCETLPEIPWRYADIGAVNNRGDVCENDDTYTLRASGNALSDIDDAFFYTFKPFDTKSSGEIKARIVSVDNTGTAGACGIMFRKNVDPGSPNVFLSLTSADEISFTNRLVQAGKSFSSGVSADIKTPHWVKLVKNGDKYVAYTSDDGNEWSALDSVNIAMGTYPFAGIAFTSGNNASLGTAIVDNLSVTDYNKAPLELNNLVVKNTDDKYAQLNWASANESTGDIFYIQRSKDGAFFTTIDSMNAIVGIGAHQYKSADHRPFSGTNYYRIQQQSLNGQLKYSNVAAVSFQTYSLEVYPNPVNRNLFIKYADDLGPGQKINLQLISTAGQAIVNYNTTVPVASTTIIMTLPGNTKNGIYILRVVNAQGKSTVKKIVVKN